MYFFLDNVQHCVLGHDVRDPASRRHADSEGDTCSVVGGEVPRHYAEEKMESLRAEQRSASEEVERLKARRQMAEAAQRDMEALIESYAKAVPEDLDCLTPEERHEIYRMLGLGVNLDSTGAVEISGVVSVPEKREHVNSGCR